MLHLLNTATLLRCYGRQVGGLGGAHTTGFVGPHVADPLRLGRPVVSLHRRAALRFDSAMPCSIQSVSFDDAWIGPLKCVECVCELPSSRAQQRLLDKIEACAAPQHGDGRRGLLAADGADHAGGRGGAPAVNAARPAADLPPQPELRHPGRVLHFALP